MAQGPGGYGGGGPYGPPGGGGYGGPPPGGGGYPPPGGGPPGGGGYPPPGGAPPGGYGPPGYGGPPQGGPPQGPPGYGQPQGYGGYPGGPPGPPGGPPPKKSKTLLFVGLGCGVLFLLGAAASIGAYLYVRHKVSDEATAIANFADAGVLAAPSPGSVSATCAKAIACCKAVTSKSAGSNGALVEQACNGIGMLADAQCLQQYNALKTSASAVNATCE